jgi:hypothetical protein
MANDISIVVEQAFISMEGVYPIKCQEHFKDIACPAEVLRNAIGRMA